MSETVPVAHSGSARAGWWQEWEVAALAILVLVCYFGRLSALSIRGEESRRGRVAGEMLERGDWIVPRQQGVPYLSRPPLGSWLIALVGIARGKVDALAVRLPSATAVLLTTLLIYAYSRRLLTRLGALAATAAFATLPQVLDLGRLGETEAVFTLLVGGSLLLWHWGYSAAWPASVTWTAGYALAALAGMDKGPQGPLYFVAPVFVYLIAKRDWRFLFGGSHLAGVGAFALVLGLWQIPFLRATNWQAVAEIWCNNARERFTDRRPLDYIAHMAGYPFEIFACLLPWSALLGLFAFPRFRRSLVGVRPHLQFLGISLAVTFATVWCAPAAKGRYFMPLYPCFAVLVGVVVEFCVIGNGRDCEETCKETNGWARGIWKTYLYLVGALAALAGVTGAVAGFVTLPGIPLPVSTAGRPTVYLVFCVLGMCAAALVLVHASRQATPGRARLGILAVAGFIGLSYLTVIVDLRMALSADIPASIAQLKARLPQGKRLVSLGSVDHLFIWLYGTPIPLEPEPTDQCGPAADVEYFCFNEHPPETVRWPFAWERVATVPLERNTVTHPHRTVVVGRCLRDTTTPKYDEPSLQRTAELDKTVENN